MTRERTERRRSGQVGRPNREAPAIVTTRPESPSDQAAIREIHEQAFARVDEADLVEALGTEGLARLSLVAVRGGEVLGHVLFSEITLDADGARRPCLALAPLAVHPEHQRRGLGARLVMDGLARVRAGEPRLVFVLGDPGYYEKFGFSAPDAASFEARYAGPAFQVWRPAAASDLPRRGVLRYSAPFGKF